MSAVALGPGEFRRALAHVCRQVLAARAELTALDAAAGDGDLGESLATGFAAVQQALAGLGEDATIGTVLTAAGTALAKAAPSTFGTLLGMAWRDAGRALADAAELTPAGVVRMLDVMAQGVARRGEVTAGQRTMLDGLLAARDHAQAAGGHAQAAGAGRVDAVLAAAASGARAGATATAAMRPQVGRAGWIPDRALGTPDAGASAWAVIAGALAEAVPAAAVPAAAVPATAVLARAVPAEAVDR